jgi:hypothetical protein
MTVAFVNSPSKYGYQEELIFQPLPASAQLRLGHDYLRERRPKEFGHPPIAIINEAYQRGMWPGGLNRRLLEVIKTT